MYVDELDHLILTWIHIWSALGVGLGLKYDSMNKYKDEEKSYWQLTERFQNAHLVFQNDPSEENATIAHRVGSENSPQRTFKNAI